MIDRVQMRENMERTKAQAEAAMRRGDARMASDLIKRAEGLREALDQTWIEVRGPRACSDMATIYNR